RPRQVLRREIEFQGRVPRRRYRHSLSVPVLRNYNVVHRWPSLLASGSVPTRSKRRSARGEWAKSTALVIRGLAVRSQSKFFPYPLLAILLGCTVLNRER